MTDAEQQPDERWLAVLRALASDPDGQFSQVGAARAARLIQTVAQPARIGIITLLAADAPVPVSRDALGAALGLEADEMAEHVNALSAAGVVTVEASEPTTTYRLTDPGKAALTLLALVGLPDT